MSFLLRCQTLSVIFLLVTFMNMAGPAQWLVRLTFGSPGSPLFMNLFSYHKIGMCGFCWHWVKNAWNQNDINQIMVTGRKLTNGRAAEVCKGYLNFPDNIVDQSSPLPNSYILHVTFFLSKVESHILPIPPFVKISNLPESARAWANVSLTRMKYWFSGRYTFDPSWMAFLRRLTASDKFPFLMASSPVEDEYRILFSTSAGQGYTYMLKWILIIKRSFLTLSLRQAMIPLCVEF